MPARKKPSTVKTRTVYQFKITLVDSSPTIWRRIYVPDGTLDDLHEWIQTAMGWTNSHLHQFEIDGRRYGDPDLLEDCWEDADFFDSRETQLSELLGGQHPPHTIHYMYDFGDGWEHVVEFEGTQPTDAGKKYPCCVDGARACPPEDVGGIWGYPEFLEAIRNPKHEQHEWYLEWAGDEFNPEAFDAADATEAMLSGLPDWRDEG